jgi:hypothetical protein
MAASQKNHFQNTMNELICQMPNTSIREIARQTQTSYSLTRKNPMNKIRFGTLQDSIGSFQRISKDLNDYKKRTDFAHCYFGQSWAIVNKILFYYKAHFPLAQPLNKQNNRIWSKEKPTEGLEYFFFSNNVNKQNYLKMSKDRLWP